MEGKPSNLKEILQQGYAQIAKLPAKNEFSIDKLDSLIGYTVPLISHDYSAKTPMMWNTLYEKLNLNIRNIMLVADPKNSRIIIPALKNDPKYLGGGFGVGWKEKLESLDEIKPADLGAVNIVVKEQGRLIGYNTDAAGFVKSLEDKLAGLGKKIQGQAIAVVGAGGVAKEVVKLLAEKGVRYLPIINRTTKKAVALANALNEKYGVDTNVFESFGVGENMTRSILLNSEEKPCAIINLSDKGSDSLIDVPYLYASTDENGNPLSPITMEKFTRDMVEYAINLNPDIIYADIVLPKTPSGRSKTLNLVDAELRKNLSRKGKNSDESEKYLLDGKPMVVYQAVPAYDKIQQANSDKHSNKTSQEEIFKVFKQAAEV
ncbi:MAG TPA: hypothetical protein VJ438_03465 [Candidatus Nanoarchaeia archaeon]|nr:hypothetical protein [Candidatus Nanoarchaeia archaeon]